MIRLWCWLFAACVPPPHAPARVAHPPAAHAASAPDSVAAAQADDAERATAAFPAPEKTIRLALAAARPLPPPTPPESAKPAEPEAPPALWQRNAVAAAPRLGRPTLSFVIDDMGANPAQTARAIALPAPLTLSWLPAVPHLAEQIAAGSAHGHETMLQMPMEALGRADPGPGTLRTWLPPQTNLANLRTALDLVPNAVALTQYEGSVASLSVPLMDLVVGELQARRMGLLDSLPIPHDVALRRAAAAGLPAAARDVIIDADPAPPAIRTRLAEAEEIARKTGHAILIGHARPATLDVLEPYLPALAARGFVLWPVSAAIATAARPRPAAVAASDLPPPPAAEGDATVAPLNISGAE